MQAPDSPFLDQKGMGGRLVLGILAWRQGEPLNDPQGGWEGSACSPQAAPAQTKLPPAASTFSPSWAKKLWQFSAMHCLLEACRCPGVCVCVCVQGGIAGRWGWASTELSHRAQPRGPEQQSCLITSKARLLSRITTGRCGYHVSKFTQLSPD